jgi:hypothetical protein
MVLGVSFEFYIVIKEMINNFVLVVKYILSFTKTFLLIIVIGIVIDD